MYTDVPPVKRAAGGHSDGFTSTAAILTTAFVGPDGRGPLVSA